MSLVDNSVAPVVFDNEGNLNITAGSSYVIKDYDKPEKPFKHNGNILVDGGSTLTILNSTIFFRPDKFVNVTAGSTLRIENSYVTVDINTIQATYDLFFQILNSNFTIYNSTFVFPGTFNVTGSNFTAVNSIFDQLDKPTNLGSPTLIFNSSNVYYEDCQVLNFDRFDDIEVSGSTSFIAVNTFFDLDYQDESTLFIDHTSTAMLYGMTLNPGTWPYTNSPIRILNSSGYVNIFRWLFVNVTDLLNTPIGNTEVTAKNINLGQYSPVPPQYILDYLKRGNTTSTDYNITNSSGYVILPLLTDNITFSSSPNSIFIGNYELTAYHNQFNSSINIGLKSFPILTDEANNPQNTIKFSDLLISPVNNAYFSKTGKDIRIVNDTGTIRNSVYQKPQGGVVKLNFGQQGNIEVINGTLNMYTTGLGIEQDMNNKYYILIDNGSELLLSEKSGIMDGDVSPGVYPINIYVDDTSTLSLENNSALADIGALGIFKDSSVSFDSSSIDGDLFYANGENQNLMVTAINHSKINVTTLTISDAMVTMEDSEILSIDQPMLSTVNMEAKNCTFGNQLAFTNNSQAELINVSEPNFFNISAMDTSIANVYWWLTVVVEDSQGNSISGATVTIENYTYENNKLTTLTYKTGVTDSNGEYMDYVLGGIIDYNPVTGKVRRTYGGITGNYFITATLGGGRSSRSRQTSTLDVFGLNQKVVIVIEGGPDLEVTKITPIEAVKNTDMKIFATIRNNGNFNASNIEVEFWDGIRETQLGEAQIIQNLNANASTVVSVDQHFLTEGNYNIIVRVDPNKKIGETNELNNIANITLKVISEDRADLIISSLTTEPISPISNKSKVTIRVTIENIGNADADNFKVRFYMNFTDSPDLEFQLGEDRAIVDLEAESDFDLEETWIANQIGNYKIRVEVDVLNEIDERSEENNSLSIDIQVVIGPDFTVSKVVFEPSTQITREKPFIIKATIDNIGPSTSGPFKVGFYLGSLSNKFGEKDVDPLDPSNSTVVEITYTINNVGTYKIIVEVDPDDMISEPNEDNNAVEVFVDIIKKADLVVEDIQFPFPVLENGVDTKINITIKNIGETDSQDFRIRVFDGHPDLNQQIKTDIKFNSGLGTGASQTVSVEWNSTLGGDHEIWVIIIPITDLATLDEEDKENNNALKIIYVMYKADLYVMGIKLNREPNEEILTEDPVEITVLIGNQGDTRASNFRIEMYDGPTSNDENIFYNETPNIILDGNSNVSHKITWSSEIAGTHFIAVVLDRNNIIDEIRDDNNEGKITIFLNETAPDLQILSIADQLLPKIVNPDPDGDSVLTLDDKLVVDKEQVWFEFTIGNMGKEFAYNFSVLVLADDDKELLRENIHNLSNEYTGNFEPLKDMTTNMTSFVYKPDDEFYKLTIILDPDDRVRETNEKNNKLVIENAFKVLKSDIAIESIVVEKEGVEVVGALGDFVKDDQVDVKATVINHGSHTVNIEVAFSLNAVPALTETTAIEPGATKDFKYSFKVTSDKQGTDIGEVTIDIESTVIDGKNVTMDRDSDPINDVMPFSVNYGKKDNGDKDGPPVPIWAILLIIIIIVIVLLIALLLMRKKKREKMAECSECGALIPVAATSCGKCGAEFSDEIECGECGALMKITDTKCPVCGAAFTKEAEGEEGEEEEELGKPPVGPAKPAGRKPEVPSKKGIAAKPKGAAPAAPAAAKPPAAPAIPAPPAGAGPAAAPAADAPKEEGEKAECYRCGAVVPLSASMCPECGAEFE
jgi:subtilase family serine protease/ribosomal protein L40E/predicted small secreted protein